MLQAQQTNENQAVNPGQDNLNNQIERNYMINQRQYSYKGPENEEINQLLIILERCAIQDQQMYNKWVEKIRDLLNKVLLKYEKDFNSSYAKFKLEINLQIYDLIVCLVYIILWIIALSNSLDLDNDNIKSSQFKSDISSQLPIYLSLLTFSTLAFQNIQMFSLWVLLFISLVLIPLVVMIYNLSQQIDGEQSNYQSIGFCILSYLIFIISYINKGMTTYLTRIFNQLIGAFYKCGFCLFVMYLLFFKIILLILSEEFDSSENFIEQTITIVAPSAFIIIFAFSILIYRDLFKLSPIQIEMDLGLLANTKQPDYYIRNDLIIRINKIIDDTIKKLNLKQTVPIIIFVSFCFLETFCFGSTLYELKNGDLELSLNFAGFFIMIPLFLFLTIHMLNSGYHPQKLYLYGTLFYVVILGFICLMFQNLLKEIDYFQTIAKMIGMGPLFISLAWSTIGYFRSEKKDYQMLTFGIVFICFAFPLGFLYLLFDSDQLNYSALQAFFWIFICLGLIPILILIIYYVYIIGFYLYDSIQRFQNNNFSTAFKCIDLNNYAQWFNQTFFTIGFYAVCYYVQNEPQLNQSNIKKGVLQGLLIVLIVLFILINKSLVLDKANVSTSYQLEEYSNNCLYYIIYLIILMLLIILPIALTISNKTLSYALLINVICLPIVSYFYYYLILIKKQQFYGNYQNFLIPLIIIFTWIFFIGPFGIIAPVIAVNYESQTKEFSIFAQAFTTYFILLTIFFINIRAIFKSLILNKEQQEMKKQKVLKEIIRKLFSYGVLLIQNTVNYLYYIFK